MPLAGRASADGAAHGAAVVLWGFERDDGGDGLGLLAWSLRVPYWSAVLALAVGPAARVYGVLRRARETRAGLCARCGYDLRATPERCPECGTVVRP